ncbi:MAG: glycosyltransferase [bacterium]|nr:glycosyltransferase [bacterium]
MEFVLLEPTRPPGFVSGGYRYQDEIMRRLKGRGHEQLAVTADQVDEAVAATLRTGATPVVDGLFIERTQRPLPVNVIALLHMVPSLARWCDAPVDAIVTGESTRAAVAAASRSVALVRPGLDATFAPPTTSNESTSLRVLCVGTLSPAKGQHLVAAAARQAHASGAAIELVCIGDRSAADHVAEVHRAAGTVPLELRGCLPPAAIAQEMRRADLFVSASRSESFGMAAAEAAASGLPMVAFATGAIPSFAATADRMVPDDTSDEAMIDLLAEVFAAPRPARTSARRTLDNWDTVADRFAAAVDDASRDRRAP